MCAHRYFINMSAQFMSGHVSEILLAYWRTKHQWAPVEKKFTNKKQRPPLPFNFSLDLLRTRHCTTIFSQSSVVALVLFHNCYSRSITTYRFSWFRTITSCIICLLYWFFIRLEELRLSAWKSSKITTTLNTSPGRLLLDADVYESQHYK